jgi:lipopolysaccharide transport system ATP-binding protein
MTTSLRAENVTVEFPLYGAQARSLKRSLLSVSTGGRFGRRADDSPMVVALNGVDFEIREGERVALLGHNGAGKTTLLRVLAGIYEPVRGAVHSAGRVAPLFDISLGFDPDATGYENILLRGLVLGIPYGRIGALRDGIAEFSGLGDYLSLPVRTYSSGMLLRLGFAITTSIAPDILLMDEWLSVGDSRFLHQAEARMDQLVGASGILVLATHSQALAARICTRAILLEKGRILADGPVPEILARMAEPAPDAEPGRAAGDLMPA